MRIVLVDPSRTVLKCVARMLEARGHEVRGFTAGEEALAYLRSDVEVEALITGAELVTMTGVELCWEARLLASTRRPLYVIVMSSLRDHHKVSEALDAGADDFIGKPPDTDELYARLRAAERLEAMQRELIRMATTDPLTGLLNRRAFFERGSEALQAIGANGADGALSLVMLDIDHFKKVNDVHGHDSGDQVLRRVAQEAADIGHVAGRLGGEEFVILLDGVAESEAAAIAETLRAAIARLRIDTARGCVAPTCSFGVAGWRPGDSLDGLLKRADLALYDAKDSGRDRVVVFDPMRRPVRDAAASSVVRAAPRVAAGACGTAAEPTAAVGRA